MLQYRCTPDRGQKGPCCFTALSHPHKRQDRDHDLQNKDGDRDHCLIHLSSLHNKGVVCAMLIPEDMRAYVLHYIIGRKWRNSSPSRQF